MTYRLTIKICKCLGPAGAYCKIVCVLICGKSGVVFGKRLTFLRNSPYVQVKYNNTFVNLMSLGQIFAYLKAKSVKKKYIHDYIRD